MPSYAWSCLACGNRNEPAAETCAACNCPARATAAQFDASRAMYLARGGVVRAVSAAISATGEPSALQVLGWVIGAVCGVWPFPSKRRLASLAARTKKMNIILRSGVVLSAIGFLAGCILVLFSFIVTPEQAVALRSVVLIGFVSYTLAVGTTFVLIEQTLTKGVPGREATARMYAGCSKPMRACGYTLMTLGIVAFFISIALVEGDKVPRYIGEAAILGSFSVALYASLFCQLWSFLKLEHLNVA
jgi:hypothetical protein